MVHLSDLISRGLKLLVTCEQRGCCRAASIDPQPVMECLGDVPVPEAGVIAIEQGRPFRCSRCGAVATSTRPAYQPVAGNGADMDFSTWGIVPGLREGH